MKKTSRLLAVLLAAVMMFGVSAAAAEVAEAAKSYEKFEDVAIYVEIPDTVMYVTTYSPEDAPLYTALAMAGYTYDSFREYMTMNNIKAYGIFLTDAETEFQIVSDHIGAEIDFSTYTEEELQEYLKICNNAIATLGATVEGSGVYTGTNYKGFWFHYTVTINGTAQNVIQYSLYHSNRVVNIRAYNMSGLYPADAEEIIRGIFDSIVVN